MGQNVSISQRQSKEELLYEAAINGNVETVKILCSDGASLEWMDQEGKTPLIVACMSPGLYSTAKTLIELGANINAYRPGRHAGTPLHHAAKRGMNDIVKLLLSKGANALLMNDDCQTPVDVARVKGFTNVVRTIENHICYFSGWVRELLAPGFLKALAFQLLSRKIWVVVLPCTTNPSKPLKLELVIYNNTQESQPRSVIRLWKANIEKPKFHQSDPALIIFDKLTGTGYKLAPAIDGDKQQIQSFYNACVGIPQSASEERPPLPSNIDQAPETSSTNGWGTLSDSSSHNGWGPAGRPNHSEASSSGWIDQQPNKGYNGWVALSPGMDDNPSKLNLSQDKIQPIVQTNEGIPANPSAPPIPEDFDNGPIRYPTIDSSPVVDVPNPVPASVNGTSSDGEGSSSSCIICWEAPVEGACIPCGHMAGCMSCLNEIKGKKGDCPVCRAKINQVIRLYAV